MEGRSREQQNLPGSEENKEKLGKKMFRIVCEQGGAFIVTMAVSASSVGGKQGGSMVG